MRSLLLAIVSLSISCTLVACGKVESDRPDGPPDDPGTFTLTVTVTGNGTVTSSPAGINCGSDCSEAYAAGTAVTLTAAASAGSTFGGWNGAGCSGTDTCAVTVSAAASVTATFNAFQWPDSLTAYCTDGTATVACPGGVAGQDGNYSIGVPVYNAATDTVMDTTAGLMWQRNPPYQYASYNAADGYCQNLMLAGFSDWRVPTILELISLVDAGRIGPPWPTAAFPNIPGNSFFWSSTAYTAVANQHFAINTNYPVSYVKADTDTIEFVRCVRGSAFTGSLTVSGSSVTDTRTGLVWQSSTGGTGTWQEALAYCENLSLDGASNWRLPNTKELLSIVDYTRTSPAISTAFASRPSGVFWSSTPTPNFPTSGYAIDFTSGATSGINTAFTTALNIRCVH